MKSIQYSLVLFLSLVVLSSCTGKKKMIYFQGNISNSETNKNYNPIINKDDLLSVTIMGIDAETVKPFNLPVQNIANNLGGYTQGTPPPLGYLVDPEGYIELPVIGRVKVVGLTRSIVIDTLKHRLKPYITNPTVLIRVLNYKVTVLGEVRNPGTFTIPNERITLPEALGIAGDLLITGKRQNVLVVRDVDGKKTEYRVDLTSKELFSSPVYYLNQNDVVYVEPNRTKINSSVINPANAGIVISAVSLIVTVLALITR